MHQPFTPMQKNALILLLLFTASLLCVARQPQQYNSDSTSEPPRDSVPDDHLAWFGLHGPVAEVMEYDFSGYSKTLWRFDTQGRLTEYENYGSPFAGDGGCVFRLTDRYRYAYDKDGKIIFLETFNDEYTLIDEYADIILEMFPPQDKSAWLFQKAEKEYGDTTFCMSAWRDGDEAQHYNGIRFDRHGNWIESVSAELGDDMKAGVRVRTIQYYCDIEMMGLAVGVKTVKHKWEADGKTWENEYRFDRDGNLLHFQSLCDKEPLFDWDKASSDEPGSDLIVRDKDDTIIREITYWE